MFVDVLLQQYGLASSPHKKMPQVATGPGQYGEKWSRCELNPSFMKRANLTTCRPTTKKNNAHCSKILVILQSLTKDNGTSFNSFKEEGKKFPFQKLFQTLHGGWIRDSKLMEARRPGENLL